MIRFESECEDPLLLLRSVHTFHTNIPFTTSRGDSECILKLSGGT